MAQQVKALDITSGDQSVVLRPTHMVHMLTYIHSTQI